MNLDEIKEWLDDREGNGADTACFRVADVRDLVNMLESYQIANAEWVEKTSWVQSDCESGAIEALAGEHRADIMTREIMRLRNTLLASTELCNIREEQLEQELQEIERLRKALREYAKIENWQVYNGHFVWREYDEYPWVKALGTLGDE